MKIQCIYSPQYAHFRPGPIGALNDAQVTVVVKVDTMASKVHSKVDLFTLIFKSPGKMCLTLSADSSTSVTITSHSVAIVVQNVYPLLLSPLQSQVIYLTRVSKTHN